MQYKQQRQTRPPAITGRFANVVVAGGVILGELYCTGRGLQPQSRTLAHRTARLRSLLSVSALLLCVMLPYTFRSTVPPVYIHSSWEAHEVPVPVRPTRIKRNVSAFTTSVLPVQMICVGLNKRRRALGPEIENILVKIRAAYLSPTRQRRRQHSADTCAPRIEFPRKLRGVHSPFPLSSISAGVLWVRTVNDQKEAASGTAPPHSFLPPQMPQPHAAGRTHLDFSVGRRVLVALEQASFPLGRQVERLGIIRRRPNP